MKSIGSLLFKCALISASAVILSSCNKGTTSTLPISGISIDQSELIEIKDVKSGLEVLNKEKNYSFKCKSQIGLDIENETMLKFNENFVGRESDILEETDLIIKDNQGIYHLSYEDSFLSGEYLKDGKGNNYTSLYDNLKVKSMFGVETSYVDSVSDGLNSLIISNKAYKIAFIQTFGFDSTDYAHLISLSANFTDNGFGFTLSFSTGAIYTYSLCDHGTTWSANYANFLNNGGKAFTPSDEISQFRALIKSNNFYQNLFYFDTELEGNGVYYLRYAFAPHYFYQYSLSDSKNMTGYIEANNSDLNLYGIYSFNVVDNVIDSINTNVMFTRPDIITFNHYPSLLKLLDNLEFIKTGSIDGARVDFEGSNKYYFKNESLINDFKSNFSLDNSSFADFDCAGVEIEINLNYRNPANDNIEEPVCCFHYLFRYGGTTYDYPFPLFGFGKATNEGLDNLYRQLNPVK